MGTVGDGGLAALQSLLRSAHLSRADDLPSLVTAAGRLIGADRAVLYVIDYDQLLLVPLLDPERPAGEPLSVDGTLGGRAFRDVALHTSSGDAGVTAWVPLIDGTERVGVLELGYPADTELDDEDQAICRDVAGLVAELVSTRSMYGDAVERARRRAPLTLPAELQWRLLPPLTFVSPRIAVAGGVAPTTEVAGDSFDYAVNGSVAHVAILDAMGHGLEATLLASVAVAALRNTRRRGCGLVETVRTIDLELGAHFGPDKFVTAIVGELDTATGGWRWVSCGHPPALLIRGGRVVKTLDSVSGVPLGLGLLPDRLEVGESRLEPGDRLLLYTDGVIEARDAAGDFFGTDRLVDFISRQSAAGQPAAETLRRLNLALLGYQDGALQDDATTVMVEWLTDEAERSLP